MHWGLRIGTSRGGALRAISVSVSQDSATALRWGNFRIAALDRYVERERADSWQSTVKNYMHGVVCIHKLHASLKSLTNGVAQHLYPIVLLNNPLGLALNPNGFMAHIMPREWWFERRGRHENV